MVSIFLFIVCCFGPAGLAASVMFLGERRCSAQARAQLAQVEYTGGMQIVHALEPLPTEVTATLFLAGPTPRSADVVSWRKEALVRLEALGFQGTVFVPELRDGWSHDYYAQVGWEEAALDRADCIVFWVPREMKTMPALTTNVEWGMRWDSGRVVLGAPPEATKVRYLQHYAGKAHAPSCTSLDETLRAALTMVGTGTVRKGGECQVPLNVWRHRTFQSWLAHQRVAGNRLDGAKVLWTFRVGPKRDFVFCWAVHVDVHVAAEGRNKTNEFVFGRTDLSSVVLWTPGAEGGRLDLDAKVVIVREFRSPARTADGFIRELPGGSSKDSDEATRSVAAHEVQEETGFALDPARLCRVGVRQAAGTLSAHVVALYQCMLTPAEMASIEAEAVKGEPHGVLQDTERTYVEVWTVAELLERQAVDWATLGMVTAACARP